MTKLPGRLERRHIDTLIAVSRQGSIHGAARELGLPQPLLTKLLRDAERLAGKPLFSRSHKGCAALPEAADILSGVLYAYKALRNLDDIDQGREVRLRLGCIPRVSHSLMPALIRALGRLPAQLKVEIIEGTASALGELMAEGEIDCFFGRRPPAMAQGKKPFVIESLYEEKTVLIAHPHHALFEKSGIVLDDLLDYPWVLPRKDSYSRAIWNELFMRKGLAAPQPMFESLSFLSNLHLTAQSDCISIAPDRAVRGFEELGLIRVIKTDLNLGEYTIVMVYHPSIADRPGFEEFRSAAKLAAMEISLPRENARHL